MKESQNNKEAYQVHEIVYTSMAGKRVKVHVAEESSQKALAMLEESLMNFGYTPKNIDNMFPISKITEYKSSKTWIDFR